MTPRGFTAIFIAVGEQKNFALTILAHLRKRGLQRRLISVSSRSKREAKSATGKFWRGKFPFRRAAKHQKPRARLRFLYAAWPLENLARFFSTFLSDAARKVDPQHDVQGVGWF